MLKRFLNKLGKVIAYNVAIGQRRLELTIPMFDFEMSKSPGGFSVDPFIQTNLMRSAVNGITALNVYSTPYESVNQITIDSLPFEPPISFIKFVVEEMEYEHLRDTAEPLVKIFSLRLHWRTRDQSSNDTWKRVCR